MNQAHRSVPIRFFLYLLFLTAIALLFAFCSLRAAPSSPTQSLPECKPLTVVLDAGHGGEDGGAVSASGLLEKELNLDIAQRLEQMLKAAGVKVVMTRKEDTLLYDKNANYHGHKKEMDLAARLAIAEQTTDSIFVSIHMNAYHSTKERGLQVWYSPHHPASYDLASLVQGNVKQLQPENARRIKAAGSNIYLLHHLKTPAILVECGFLSNPPEAAMLADENYREQLAFLLFASILQLQG